jgi:hypothetical protein
MRLATKSHKKPQKATKRHKMPQTPNATNFTETLIEPQRHNHGEEEEEGDRLKQGDGAVIRGGGTS